MRRFTVMLVDLRKAVREIESLMIDRMSKGQFNKVQFRKHLLQLRTYVGIQPVIVVDMQEPASDEVLPAGWRLRQDLTPNFRDPSYGQRDN